MAISVQVTIDCADPKGLATFWSQVLGYRLPDPPAGFVTWDAWAEANGIPEEQRNDFAAAEDPDGVGPRLFFQRVPEPKAAKNRLHLDVNASGPRGTPAGERRAALPREVERIVALGATRGEEFDDGMGHWVVMTDPEGNEFCVQ